MYCCNNAGRLYGILIIAILAALLLPALDKARQKAQGALCVNNLKQCGLSWLLYAHDYNDLTLAYSGHYNWSGIYQTSPTGPAGPYGATLHFLGLIKNNNVMVCPSANPTTFSGVWLTYGTGAAYSGFINSDAINTVTGTHTNDTTFVILRRLTKPSIALGLADSLGPTLQQAGVLNATITTVGNLHLRHTKRCNAWHFDGHVNAMGPEGIRELWTNFYPTSSLFYYRDTNGTPIKM